VEKAVITQPSGHAKITPLGQVMGAEVEGLNLALPISGETREQLSQAFDKYKVLAFRNQKLTGDQFLGFAGIWGSLGEHVLTLMAREASRRVQIISNAGTDGKPIQEHPDPSALLWHTDKSYMPRPSLATLLYAVQIPGAGADTLFADVCEAYDALPAATKREIADLEVIHSFEHAYETAGMKASDEEREAAPPVTHPLVKHCSNTGREAIYCGMYARKIVGWSEAESRELLQHLEKHATQDRFQYRHKWRLNDLIVWDNRSTLHAATPFDTAHEIRTLYRTFVEDRTIAKIQGS
jgi:taurine dioxygenase